MIIPYSDAQRNTVQLSFTQDSNNSTNTANNSIYYVSITSSFPGQPQELSVPKNGSGFFMYPLWTFTLFSDAGKGNITTYQIYVNGLELTSGSFNFMTSYSTNMSFNMVNVSIIIQSSAGVQVWNYHDIPILHSTLSSYYKATFIEKPVYTVTQYLEFGAKIALTAVFVLIASYFVVYKSYVKKKEETVERLL